MYYIYDKYDYTDEPLHIQKHTLVGEGLMKAICGINLIFNTIINSAYPIDVKICKGCNKEYSKILMEK